MGHRAEPAGGPAGADQRAVLAHHLLVSVLVAAGLSRRLFLRYRLAGLILSHHWLVAAVIVGNRHRSGRGQR